MKTMLVAIAVMLSLPTAAQETKRVPKDSVRVFVPGCSRGLVFTAGPRTEDQQGSSSVPEGMHLRMSGKKALLNEITRQEGVMLEISGLVRKNDLSPSGLKIGGVRISPGLSSSSGPGSMPTLGEGQVVIDVEGWRRVPGDCPSR